MSLLETLTGGRKDVRTSDLNQPDLIYQFMQLANHNAVWNSKLGAAFGLQSISKTAKVKMEPYLKKIVPRLYRYKYINKCIVHW